MTKPQTYGIKPFAAFCETLILENGKPFKLLPYERTILKEYFAGARETVIIMPKKQGKTSLMGALALFHLKEIPGAECVIAAASRDQARILFKQAAGLVHRSELESIFDVKPGYGEIRLTEDGPHRVGARIRVLAADSSTADGVIPTLALVDELHRHPSADLYGVFRDGLGPRNGKIVTISTAGASLESPLGVLRSKAQLLPSFRREGAYSHAASEDGAFVFHEWSLEQDADTSDLELVKQANPAPWHTLASLRERLESPSTTPGQWARFACGIWVEGEDLFISPQEWDACDEPLPALDGMECYGGLDLSATTDTTAFSLIFPVDGKVLVKSYSFLPKDDLAKRIARDRAPYDEWAKTEDLILTPGNVVDYAFVKKTVLDAATKYKIRELGYDRWNASQLVSELQDEGINMVPVGQGFQSLSQPMQELRRLVLARKLIHGANPILRRHILSMAVVSDPAGNTKPAKNRSIGRIDAAAALITALGVSVRAEPEQPARKSAYESQLCSCGLHSPTPHIRQGNCAA